MPLKRLLASAISAAAITIFAAACSSTTSSSAGSSTPQVSVATPSAASSPTTGLPAYTTPPPDQSGNPPCQFGVNWSTFYADEGQPNSTRITVDKQNMTGLRSDFVVLPDTYKIVVETKDGQRHTREELVSAAATGQWDSSSEKDFLFPDVDPAAVQSVQMTTSKGTCWVDGRP